MRMLTDAYSDWICRWVAEQLGEPGAFAGRAHGIAVIHHDNPIAGVVYHDWTDHNTMISIASTSPYWASKLTLRGIFGYAFNQMQVNRVSVIVRDGKETAKWRKTLIHRFGFVHEARCDDWFGKGEHGHLLRMKRNECKWIDHGQGQQQRRAAV